MTTEIRMHEGQFVGSMSRPGMGSVEIFKTDTVFGLIDVEECVVVEFGDQDMVTAAAEDAKNDYLELGFRTDALAIIRFDKDVSAKKIEAMIKSPDLLRLFLSQKSGYGCRSL